MAVILSIPDFGNSYVFDDINFLARAQALRLSDLLPEQGAIFYRPVSREIYFGLLNWAFPTSPLPGHILNGLLLGAVVWLLGRFTQRLVGETAGILAAFLLAAFGQRPVLIAWVCGSQDLFAMFFVVLALNFELRRQGGRSALALAGAILSKETAIAAIPAFLVVRWLSSHSRKETLLAALRLGALTAAWLGVHPGIRILAGRGWASPTGGYIGLNNPDRWDSLLRSLPVLLNLPLIGRLSFPVDEPGSDGPPGCTPEPTRCAETLRWEVAERGQVHIPGTCLPGGWEGASSRAMPPSARPAAG